MAWKIEDNHIGMMQPHAQAFLQHILTKRLNLEQVVETWNILVGPATIEDGDIKVLASDVAEHISDFLE